jgi:predicted SAM-dependent methyltransferase
LEGQFELVVCEHVIEHLLPDEVFGFFTNIFAFLARGGVLIVSFPDLGRVLGGGLCQGYQSPIVSVNSLIYRHGHCFMYDTQLVAELLRQVGFDSVASKSRGELDAKEFLSAGREPETSYVIAHRP